MTTSRRLAPLPLLLIGLAVLAALVLSPWVVHAQTPPNQSATGLPRVFPSAEGAGILFADPSGIDDPDGLGRVGRDDDGSLRYIWSYQWIRVDGETGSETYVGVDSPSYQPVDADIGNLIKVQVSFEDGAGFSESPTSHPFGPIAEPAGPSPNTGVLVSNTGQSASATANITQQYAQGFRLGTHGQGYEISSVSIELAAAPSDLTVSLWSAGPDGVQHHTLAGHKLFDFENPSSFTAGLNKFTAPAGAFAYQNVNYFIVLSGFGASLSIKQTTSDAEDSGGETGAVLFNDARVRAPGSTGRWSSSSSRSSVLRLALEGSQRDRGILAANYAQAPGDSLDQEILSIGDLWTVKMDAGSADRYLIRGASFLGDDTTDAGGFWLNPLSLWNRGSSDTNPGAKRVTLINSRDIAGIIVYTAPQGATVEGSASYLIGQDARSNFVRISAVLIRMFAPDAHDEDTPAGGVTLSDGIGNADLDPDGVAYMAVLGEPLHEMVSNFGQTNNGYVSLGSASSKVVSQGFRTGSYAGVYPLRGIGVNIEGSNSQFPSRPTGVAVSVHADSGGKPGAKLFDLVSPSEFRAGHSFFEAPPGTVLEPNTSYVLVWRYVGGTWHRLQRTSSDGQDSGALAGFSMANAFYRGADLENLSEDSGSNALEIAVYGEVLDTASGVTVSKDTLSVVEGSTGTYTVVLDAEPTGGVTIDVTGGGDVSVSPTSLTFTSSNWETAQTITHEVATGSAPEYAGFVIDSVAVTVTDDDPAVTVSFELANYSVAEGDSVTVKVQLSEDPKGAVTIPLTRTNQSGASSLDYSGVPSSVTFQSGETEKSFTFTAAQDTVDDDGERVRLGFGALPERVTAGARDDATVMITDNDDPIVTVSFSQASHSVAEGGSVTVRVRLDKNPERTVTIPLRRTNRGGASSADYSGVPSSVTFNSVDTEKSFTFTAAQDTADDDGESVRLGFSTLPSRVSAGSTSQTTVSITDDDDPVVAVSFELADYSVAEGDGVQVKVRLSANPERTVTISIGKNNQDGATFADYLGVPSSITSNEGETEKSFTFTAVLDSVQDDAERVVLNFVGLPPRVNRGARDEATVLITDDDAPAVTVSFEQAAYPVSEGGSVTVRVELNANPERTVTVPLNRTNQGGATGADYSGVPSSVTFQSGETVRSFTLTAARDDARDDGERVRLGFGTLPAKVTAGATDEATISITNVEPVVNHPPTVSATFSPSTVYPGEYVTLDGTPSDPDGDALTTAAWTSDDGGIFASGAGLLDTAWIAPATETPRTVNLTLTMTDTGGLSASITVTVLVRPFPRPDAATGLRVIDTGLDSVHLGWTIPGQPPGVVVETVEVQPRRSRGHRLPAWDTVWTFPGPGTSAMVEGLEADTEYVFRIRLTTTHGVIADSRVLKVGTRSATLAPLHFAAVWPTQNSITLDWSTVETAAEYKLEYRKGGDTEWTRISGDFDHLPSTSDHRQAFGVAAGLDCNTQYDFRLSARGSGETRNDGKRYPSGSFGSPATTSARTGPCPREGKVTNLLVSVEPSCATLTWTSPSGDRDTGYRVERYSYTNNRSHRSETETLVEQANLVANRYEDCSPEYSRDGAEHVYIVSPLDDGGEALAVLDEQGEETGKLGSAYTSILVYGPSREPEGPRNVRLTHDGQSSRGLAWDAPRDPWLTTVRTARAGSGRQEVANDPWTTGYRVERREYLRTEDGWYLPEPWDIWSATMTVGASTTGTGTGYFGLGNSPYGALTQTAFTHPVGSGSWTVVALTIRTGTGLSLTIHEAPPPTEGLLYSAFEDWVLVVDGRSFPFELPEGGIGAGALTVEWPNHGLSWAEGQQVSVQLVEQERFEWETVRDETDGETGRSFTDSTDKGDRQFVYRVWAYNDWGNSLYSWRGDWAFNGGDPGGYPGSAEYIPPPTAQQQGGETPSNSPATGAPAIGGTPRVGETLTADTSGIADQDGLTNVSYSYQWTAGGSDIAGATGSSHELTSSEQGQTIRVRVTFTDDSDNEESLTSAATAEVTARPNRPATSAPTISGTPQVEQALTADTSGITDEDGLDNVSYSYQWIADGTDIEGATGSSYTPTSSEQGQTIQVRVDFTDDANSAETLTSAATVAVVAEPTPLTATLPDGRFQSPRHLGTDDRPQVIVAFSLAVASFEKTTPSVSLTGAAVSSVSQHEEDGLENAWIFFLDPDGNEDIVFSLVTGQPCDSGGICTGDGTTLSGGVQVTLPGPEEEEDDQQEPQSPPPAPTNLTATVNADGHIVLSWTAPDDDSVTGYRILRRRPGQGESTLLVYVADTQSTATTFTDAGVTSGVKHVYRVKAINAAGLSDWSNYVNPTP